MAPQLKARSALEEDLTPNTHQAVATAAPGTTEALYSHVNTHIQTHTHTI